MYPVHSSGQAITHICLSLLEGMAGDGLEVEAWFPSSSPEGRRAFTRDGAPRWIQGLALRLDPQGGWLRRRAERRFLGSLRPRSVAWLWPGVPVDVYREARGRGALVVAERINCHRATSRRLLDEAFARANLPPAHGITGEAAREETEKLRLSDGVFVPSPWVADSMVAAGIPEDRLLRTSYGWDPARMSAGGPGLPPSGAPTALFVGRGGLRKGLNLLLRAWERAGGPGRLAVVGRIDPELDALCAAQLARPDVLRVPFTTAVGPVYRSAQAFLFPTIEEGSPLVLYEAMAAGLACVVSPMAAGEVGRHGKDCLVVDPWDEDGWVAAIRSVLGDAALRERLGREAKSRVADYTWEKVARRRRAMIEGIWTRAFGGGGP
jgi:glycosyltransferase involved in cell wall biosynthesis